MITLYDRELSMSFAYHRLFHPKSIAILGGHWAQAVIETLQNIKYSGNIYPIHPHKKDIHGIKCYQYLKDVPEKIDACFIGVNRYKTIDIITELRQLDAGGAVCFASGFREASDDADSANLQDDLIRAAGDMPFLGPNCYGFLNYLDNAAIWPDCHGGHHCQNGVAIISQSSNIAINVTMQKRGLNIAMMICTGNQAQTDFASLIRYLADDDRITAIGIYSEGLGNIQNFADSVFYAKEKNKPVVMMKTGQSQKSQAITITHTASLAGEYQAIKALCQAIGIGFVDNLSTFIDTLHLAHHFKKLPHHHLVTMSCSGGEAALCADAIAACDDIIAYEFTTDDIARIRPTVNPLVHIDNPFDYHTFDWGDYDRLYQIFLTVMQSQQAISALILDFPTKDSGDDIAWEIVVNAWADASKKTQHQAVIITSLCDNINHQQAMIIAEKNIVPLIHIKEGIAAIEAFYHASQPARQYTYHQRVCQHITLREYDAKNYLRNAGFPVTQGSLCTSLEDCIKYLTNNKKIVMKTTTQHHKSDVKGVWLNIDDTITLQQAYTHLISLGDEILCEEMINNIVAEMIVGIHYDTVIGCYIMVGAGGIYSEILQDTVIILMNDTSDNIMQKLTTLKIYPILQGYRNQDAGNIGGLLDIIIKMQYLLCQADNMIIGMDINPLLICTDRVIIADALINL